MPPADESKHFNGARPISELVKDAAFKELRVNSALIAWNPAGQEVAHNARPMT